jgi:hypothetical protein
MLFTHGGYVGSQRVGERSLYLMISVSKLIRGMVKPEEISEPAERAWWLRTLLVLQAPRPVFGALRDDSDDSASARQEPVTAIVFLAGIAAALGAARNQGLLDDPDFDHTLVAVWVIAAGGVQGFFGYWILGAALFAGLSAVGDPGTYRNARHLLAFAAVPLALSLLVVWPLRLAVLGDSVFRAGGDDHGAGAVALDVLEVGLDLWAAALLLLGVRVVHAWSWGRSLAAFGVTIAVLVALAFGVALFA